jgi:hypothetical protein
MTDEEVASLREERRIAIRLVAIDGLDSLNDAVGSDEVLDHMLQAICIELAAVSIHAEETTAPALSVLGAMVGGLFGIGNEATDDEIMVKMHERGAELRAAIG